MPSEFVGKSTNYTKVCAIHCLYTTLHKTILGFAVPEIKPAGPNKKNVWASKILESLAQMA